MGQLSKTSALNAENAGGSLMDQWSSLHGDQQRLSVAQHQFVTTAANNAANMSGGVRDASSMGGGANGVLEQLQTAYVNLQRRTENIEDMLQFVAKTKMQYQSIIDRREFELKVEVENLVRQEKSAVLDRERSMCRSLWPLKSQSEACIMEITSLLQKYTNASQQTDEDSDGRRAAFLEEAAATLQTIRPTLNGIDQGPGFDQIYEETGIWQRSIPTWRVVVAPPEREVTVKRFQGSKIVRPQSSKARKHKRVPITKDEFVYEDSTEEIARNIITNNGKFDTSEVASSTYGYSRAQTSKPDLDTIFDGAGGNRIQVGLLKVPSDSGVVLMNNGNKPNSVRQARYCSVSMLQGNAGLLNTVQKASRSPQHSKIRPQSSKARKHKRVFLHPEEDQFVFCDEQTSDDELFSLDEIFSMVGNDEIPKKRASPHRYQDTHGVIVTASGGNHVVSSNSTRNHAVPTSSARNHVAVSNTTKNQGVVSGVFGNTIRNQGMYRRADSGPGIMVNKPQEQEEQDSDEDVLPDPDKGEESDGSDNSDAADFAVKGGSNAPSRPPPSEDEGGDGNRDGVEQNVENRDTTDQCDATNRNSDSNRNIGTNDRKASSTTDEPGASGNAKFMFYPSGRSSGSTTVAGHQKRVHVAAIDTRKEALDTKREVETAKKHLADLKTSAQSKVEKMLQIYDPNAEKEDEGEEDIFLDDDSTENDEAEIQKHLEEFYAKGGGKWKVKRPSTSSRRDSNAITSGVPTNYPITSTVVGNFTTHPVGSHESANHHLTGSNLVHHHVGSGATPGDVDRMFQILSAETGQRIQTQPRVDAQRHAVGNLDEAQNVLQQCGRNIDHERVHRLQDVVSVDQHDAFVTTAYHSGGNSASKLRTEAMRGLQDDQEIVVRDVAARQAVSRTNKIVSHTVDLVSSPRRQHTYQREMVRNDTRQHAVLRQAGDSDVPPRSDAGARGEAGGASGSTYKEPSLSGSYDDHSRNDSGSYKDSSIYFEESQHHRRPTSSPAYGKESHIKSQLQVEDHGTMIMIDPEDMSRKEEIRCYLPKTHLPEGSGEEFISVYISKRDVPVGEVLRLLKPRADRIGSIKSRRITLCLCTHEGGTPIWLCDSEMAKQALEDWKPVSEPGWPRLFIRV